MGTKKRRHLGNERHRGTSLLCLMGLVAAGCALSAASHVPQFSVKTENDPFAKMTRTIAKLGSMRSSGGGSVSLRLGKYRISGRQSLDLIVRYSADSWLFIKSGESLILLCDGKRLALSGEGSRSHRETRYPVILEVARYPVTRAQIRLIASSSEVTARLYGANYYHSLSFPPGVIANFGRFASECLDEDADTGAGGGGVGNRGD